MGLFSTTKKTYNTYDTGLGDQQYADIMASLAQGGVDVGALDTALKSQGTTLQDVLTQVGQNKTGIDTANTGITGLLSNVGEGSAEGGTGLYGAINTLGTNVTGQFGDVLGDLGTLKGGQTTLTGNQNTMLDNQGTMIGNQGSITQGIADARGDITQGFADQTGRFDALDTSVGNVQGAVDTGFSNQQTNFDNRTSALDAAFNNIGTEADNRTDALQEVILKGQGGLGDRMSDLSTDVGTVTGNLDTYAGQLLENQGIMTNNQGNFQTNFGEFIDRYGTDTTRADQARADLQTGQGNILDQAAANEIAVANAQAAQQGSASKLAAGQQEQGANIQGVLEQGFSDMSARNSILADSISKAGDDTQRILAAFDPQGNLKRSEVRADGTIVGRSLDANGLLIESSYSPRGELLGTDVLDTMSAGGDTSGIMSQVA